jgi:hypothetical protein
MEIHKHFADDGSTDYITVAEALPVEQIAVELFECPQPWLSVFEFEDTGRDVHGSFSVHASNGLWVYRLTRRVWWLNGVYEARLIHGPVLRRAVSSVGRALAQEPDRHTANDR